MAVVATEQREAPSMAAAQRAADALADLGAARVLLFGSVARGDANERSDIDLIAVFDDLDYRDRRSTRDRAKEAAREAAGFDAEVIVTDRPEWRKRIAMRTSFEALVKDSVVVLADRPANSRVDWGKETDMPTTDRDQADEALKSTTEALKGVTAHLIADVNEQQALARNDSKQWDRNRFSRLIRLCALAHMGVENSIKAYAHGVLLRHPDRGQGGHNIEGLLKGFPEKDKRRFLDAITPLRSEDVSPWRTAGTYTGEPASAEALEKLTPTFAYQMFRAGWGCAEIAATELSRRYGPTGANEEIIEICSEKDWQSLAETMRDEPPFAVSTYDHRNLTAHPSAVPEPQPATGNPRGA